MGIRFEQSGSVARVVISRPEARNALDLDTLRELVAAWRRIETDDSITVGLLAADGDCFCSGGDLKTLLPLILANEQIDTVVEAFVKFIMSKPLVAAVRGVCVAGGTELLQATDIRIVSEDARFGLAEPKWSLFPNGGSTVRLPRQIPYCRAMEILLTGDLISAEEALAIGLVNRVVPAAEVETTAQAYAERIARNGPLAVQAIKRSVLETWGLPLPEAFTVETGHAARVHATEDAKEGPRAFSEKRDPVFLAR